MGVRSESGALNATACLMAVGILKEAIPRAATHLFCRVVWVVRQQEDEEGQQELGHVAQQAAATGASSGLRLRQASHRGPACAQDARLTVSTSGRRVRLNASSRHAGDACPGWAWVSRISPPVPWRPGQHPCLQLACVSAHSLAAHAAQQLGCDPRGQSPSARVRPHTWPIVAQTAV